MATIEQLDIESFITTSFDLESKPILIIDLLSPINYNVALESYYYNILALESSIYLEEV
jgi:hypothetical protein